LNIFLNVLKMRKLLCAFLNVIKPFQTNWGWRGAARCSLQMEHRTLKT
jgi:hypothetical protein